MSNSQRILLGVLIVLAVLTVSPRFVFAQTATPAAGSATPVAPVPNPCTPRFKAGSVVHQPPALFSSNGVLSNRMGIRMRYSSGNSPAPRPGEVSGLFPGLCASELKSRFTPILATAPIMAAPATEGAWARDDGDRPDTRVKTEGLLRRIG
jgi:hypothetical protein